MKWVTRERVHVDRVACPWLIKKFVDANAEFIFVPPDEVMRVAEREKAIPYDAHGQAALALAKIVHAADVAADIGMAPEAVGLEAIARGFGLLYASDHDNPAKQLPIELGLIRDKCYVTYLKPTYFGPWSIGCSRSWNYSALDCG